MSQPATGGEHAARIAGCAGRGRRSAALLRLLPVLFMIAVTACGFEPLYAKRSQGPTTELQAVRVDIIPDRAGQILRNELQLLFNPRGTRTPELYGLHVDLDARRSEVAIRRDETETRVEIATTAEYVLTALDDRRVLTRGRARSVNAYDVVGSDFANAVAEQEALEKNLNQLAQSIQSRLAVFFKRQQTAAATPERQP